jgi:hypothetical protein
MSFHTLSTIITAACTILAIILGLGLALLHLSRYTKREEQRQYVKLLFQKHSMREEISNTISRIVRISITPAVISVFCFFGVWFQSTSGFLKPIGEYYECIALVAVYLLFLTFATPLQERGQNIFNSLGSLQQRNGGANMSTYYVSSQFPTSSTKNRIER